MTFRPSSIASTNGRAAVTCFFLLLFASTAIADDRPIVPGFERFHSKANSAVAGRLLMTELRCVACHEGLPQPVHPRNAPNLQDVGTRLRPKAIQAIVSAPHEAKPGTLMPSVLPAEDRDKIAEAITHFLVADSQVVDTPPTGVVRGEKLFHEAGCVACHQPQKEGAAEIPGSVPLGFVDQKYTVSSLTEFLKNPHAVRPSGRMPNLNLGDGEARNIASYLLRDIRVPANLTYRYYEGNWQKLPNFDALEPKASGPATGFDLSVRQRDNSFGIVFDGFVQIPKSGEYEFEVGSDDGSRLIINEETLITVDGIHPMQHRRKKIILEAGAYPIRVEYFEGGGEEQLDVNVSGPGLSKQPLGPFVTSFKEPPKKDAFEWKPELAKLGKAMFAKHGCASCHNVKRDEQLVGSPLKAGAIKNMSGGCLATEPSSGVPNFHLSGTQRQSLAAAIKATNAPTEPTIASTMTTFNCYACHQRDKIGGVERSRDAWFKTKIPEMGDEGRIPPPLDGVGDKLNDAWLKHVMDNGANDRPYMLTRMPKFGVEHVGSITAAFAKADRRTEVAEIKIDAPEHRIKAGGRMLIGGDGLGCIKCHYFGKYAATGIQALDLQTMTRRLRRDWFHRYVADPQAYRPGTRMPQAWRNGKVIFDKVLDGTAPTQIEAVWQYLEQGTDAAIPSGMVAGKIELKPIFETIIYRNFIAGLSPRGIAVGHPAMVHYAWDANDMSLALIWQGGFMDAGRHWTGRGQGAEPPLGGNTYSMPRGVPIAALADLETAWPDQSKTTQFQGYRVDKDPKRAPMFSYAIGKDAVVVDYPKPVKTQPLPGIDRDLTIATQPNDTRAWYFRAAAAKSIEKMADGKTFLIDSKVEMTFLGGADDPIIRDSGGKKELLLRLRPGATNQSKITQSIRW